MKICTAILTALVLAGCATPQREDETNYAQAFQTTLTEAKLNLLALEQIDKGDIAKARWMLLLQINLNLGFLPVYQEGAHLAPSAIEDAQDFAKDALDYLTTHQEDLDLRSPAVSIAVNAIEQLLTDDPEQVKRVQTLAESLSREAKKQEQNDELQPTK